MWYFVCRFFNLSPFPLYSSLGFPFEVFQIESKSSSSLLFLTWVSTHCSNQYLHLPLTLFCSESADFYTNFPSFSVIFNMQTQKKTKMDQRKKFKLITRWLNAYSLILSLLIAASFLLRNIASASCFVKVLSSHLLWQLESIWTFKSLSY